MSIRLQNRLLHNSHTIVKIKFNEWTTLYLKVPSNAHSISTKLIATFNDWIVLWDVQELTKSEQHQKCCNKNLTILKLDLTPSKMLQYVSVLCKTTTWNHQNLRRRRAETPTAKSSISHLEIESTLFTSIFQKVRCGPELGDSKRIRPFVKI